MKIILLGIVLGLFQISLARDDGGWSSSGGGEFILSKDNPWFLGERAASWCVQHGGEEQFSLSKKDAVREIEAGIAPIIEELKLISTIKSYYEISLFGGRMRSLFGTCVLEKLIDGYDIHCGGPETYQDNLVGELLNLTSKFEYQESCDDAELTFILGDVNDKRIKRLRKDIGDFRFQRLVATAIRTEYDSPLKRGKGFIYLAADKGKYQYQGERNTYFANETFWDLMSHIPKNAPDHPDSFLNHPTKTKIHELYQGVLGAVAAHEFGHVLGLQHNSENHLMNVDFPAKIVGKGIIPIDNMTQLQRVFSRSLVNRENLRMVLNWDPFSYPEHFRDAYQYNENKEETGLYQVLFKYIEIDDFDSHSDHKIMAFEMINQYEGSLSLMELNKTTGEYDTRKVFPVNYSSEYCQRPIVREGVNVRFKNPFESWTWNYNEDSGDWDQIPGPIVFQNEQLGLIDLRDDPICGVIEVDPLKETYVEFELFHSYYLGQSSIKLSEALVGDLSHRFFEESYVMRDLSKKPTPVFTEFEE